MFVIFLSIFEMEIETFPDEYWGQMSVTMFNTEVVNERNPSLGLGFAKTQKFGFLPKLFFNQNQIFC